MTLTEATKTCFQKYVTFRGRANRPEFWKFLLFLVLANVALVILNSAIFGPTIEQGIRTTIDSSGNQVAEAFMSRQYDSGIFGTLFFLLTLLPWLAVTARRMHDIGKSAWWAYYPWGLFVVAVLGLLIATVGFAPVIAAFTGGPSVNVRIQGFFPAGLVVFAAFIHVIVWLCRQSESRTNRFGPNPNEVPS